MICPFCGAIVEQPKKHIDWHRVTGTARAGLNQHIRPILKSAVLLGEPPIDCYHCAESATWAYNEDLCCDLHIYESTGYIA